MLTGNPIADKAEYLRLAAHERRFADEYATDLRSYDNAITAAARYERLAAEIQVGA